MPDFSPIQLDLDWQCAVATPDLPSDAEARLAEIIRATLAHAGLQGSFAVSLIITTDRQMQRVNRRFRGIDAPTDVLSFPQNDAPLIPLPPDVAWTARPFGDDTHHAPGGPTPNPSPSADGEGSLGEGSSRGGDDRRASPGAISPRLEKIALPGYEGRDGEMEGRDESRPYNDGKQTFLSVTEGTGDLAMSPGMPYDDGGMMLGDIMVAAPTVARQAAAAGHSFWWEMCFLVAHGTLHLVGYDDYYEPGYRAMVAMQEAVLADCGITRDTH